jgi:hypothetical protein
MNDLFKIIACMALMSTSAHSAPVCGISGASIKTVQLDRFDGKQSLAWGCGEGHVSYFECPNKQPPCTVIITICPPGGAGRGPNYSVWENTNRP